nr:hypothetical protein [Tanacetum cinerariifolium]
MIAKMNQDDVVVLEDDKKDREVVDAVKDVEKAKVDESAQDHGRQAQSQAKIYKIDMNHANKVLSMQEDETKPAKIQEVVDVAEIYKIDMDNANKVLSMQEDETEPAEVQEVVDVVTTAKLIIEVITAASEIVTAASTIIDAAEAQVRAATLTVAPARVVVAPSRRKKGVGIWDPEEESTTSTTIPTETKSKDKGKEILVEEPKPLKKKPHIKQDKQYARELHAELNKDIDWNKANGHVKRKAKEDPVVKKYQAMKRKPQTEAQARKNIMMYLKNVAGFKMDYFKGMSYDNILPIFERYFDSNVAFLIKSKEHLEEEENRALKRINDTLAKKAAKRQKLEEEVEELKRHLQIVPNEDDDVYTEATLLA